MLSATSAAIPLAYAGEIARARAIAAEAQRRAVATGWPTAIAWAAYVSGEVEATAGEPSARAWMERAVATADAVGSTFTHGVASVTLCSLLAREGDVAGAMAGYRDLITHWLRSGSWTQLWTTVRNALMLLCDDDPALCLLSFDIADDDPRASQLQPGALRDQRALRARIRAQLGAARVAELEAERVSIDRVELVMRVRDALDSYAVGPEASARAEDQATPGSLPRHGRVERRDSGRG
jgi:hypothetical protein